MSVRLVKLLLAVSALIGAAHAIASQDLSVTAEQTRALGIVTERATLAQRRPLGTVPGRIVIPAGAAHFITVPFEAVIVDLLAHEGEQVEKGMPLARVRSATAAAAFAEVRKLEADAERMNAQANRDEQLEREGIVPARRAQESAAAARAATAAVNAGHSVLRGIERSADRGDEFILIAPAAGAVQERDVEMGATFNAGEVAYVILTSSERWVESQVPEHLLPQLRVGAHVTASCSGTAAVLEGQLIALGNRIDPTTRSALARAAISKGDALMDGALVELTLFADTSEPAFEIPATALVRDAGRDVVFVKTPTGFRVVHVQASARAAGRVVVQGALTADYEIVTAGTSALKSLLQQE